MPSLGPGLVLSLFGLLAAVAIGGALVNHLASRPLHAVPVVVAATLLQSDLGLTLAGVSFYPLDAIVLLLVGTLILQLPGGRVEPRGAGPWAVLAVLLVVAFVRGLPLFGLQTTSNSAREMLYLVVVAGFFSVQDLRIGQTDRIVRTTWMLASLYLGIVAALFFVQRGLGTYALDGTRALDASGTLIAGQAALLLMGSTVARRKWPQAVALLLLVVLSQQRTVWIAVLAGLVSLGAVSPVYRQLPRLLAGVLAGLAGLAVLFAFSSGLVASVTTAAAEPLGNEDGTFAWRVEGWNLLITAQLDGSTSNLVVGNPAGTGTERKMTSGAVIDVSAHSQYVQTFASLGLVGLLAVVAALLRPVFASIRAGASGLMLFPSVVAILVYGISYQLTVPSAVLVGILTAQVLHRGGPAHDEADAAELGMRGVMPTPDVVTGERGAVDS